MKLALIFILLIPSFAFAGWTSTSGKVTKIYSHDGLLLIDTDITDGACDIHGGFYWSTSDPDSQIMLSLALTSFSMGKKVVVVSDMTTPRCVTDRALMTHLALTSD